MLQYIKGLLTKQTDLATQQEEDDKEVDMELLDIVERQNTLLEIYEDAAIQYKEALNTVLRVAGAYLMQSGTQEVTVDDEFVNLMFNKHMTARMFKDEDGVTRIKIVSKLPGGDEQTDEDYAGCGSGGCGNCDCDEGPA